MSKSPSYLVLQGNIYYFRIAVPCSMRRAIGQREIKVSLSTSSICQARLRASAMSVYTHNLFEQLRGVPEMNSEDAMKAFIKELLRTFRQHFVEQEDNLFLTNTFSVSNLYSNQLDEHPGSIFTSHRKPQRFEKEIGVANQTLMNIHDQLYLRDYSQVAPLASSIERKVGISDPEGTDNSEERFRIMLKMQAMCFEAFIEHLHGNKCVPYPWDNPDLRTEINDQEQIQLETVIDDYVKEKESLGNWRGKTLNDNLSKLNIFCNIVGNPLLQNLDKDKIRFYKEKMVSFPKNHSKMPKYRNKNIQELIDMDIPESDRISPVTVNDNFNKVRAFLEWSKNQGYFLEDGLAPILNIKLAKRADEAKQPFTTEDLERLFYSTEYIEGSFKRPYYFWLPLLGLFTGARIEEICQLHLDDIYQIDGIWCIDINDKEEKELKNISSRRIFPMNPVLVDTFMLPAYVESLAQRGENRLFPELSKKNGRRYSHEPSKWFSRFRKKVGVVEDEEHGKRTFHSFRHTFLTLCKMNGVERMMAAQFAGHDTVSKDTTYGTYGKKYPPKVLFENVIQVLDYGLDFSKIKVPDYSRK